jgi:hypothetical protein
MMLPMQAIWIYGQELPKQRKEDHTPSKEKHQRYTRNAGRTIKGRESRVVGLTGQRDEVFLNGRTAPTSVSPSILSIANCLVARVENNSMHLPMKLSGETQPEIEIVEEGFLDCGARGKFIDQNYMKAKGFEKEPFSQPIPVYNVDGTLNKKGTIRYYIDLNIEVHGQT